MAAPVLTITEQKASISGKKKKKKTMKNVLDIPKNLKVQAHCVDPDEARKLISILERLLPSARLPLVSKPNQNSKNHTCNDIQGREEAMKKRNQLSLGVNALNRSIKHELVSAVLLVNDVQSKFLIHHLNLLCNHSKIPYLEVPGLREVTLNSLGFPCIAVGFKKGFCDFSEVVEEVKLISQTKNFSPSENSQETAPIISDCDEDMCTDKSSAITDEIPFKYLYRSSTKERVFNPDSKDQSRLTPKAGFIAVGDNDNVTGVKNSLTPSGISTKFLKKRKIELKKPADEDEEEDDDDDDDYYEVPKKKNKKDWVIDTIGTKQKIHYFPANLKRFASNPDRNSRKNK